MTGIDIVDLTSEEEEDRTDAEAMEAIIEEDKIAEEIEIEDSDAGDVSTKDIHIEDNPNRDVEEVPEGEITIETTEETEKIRKEIELIYNKKNRKKKNRAGYKKDGIKELRKELYSSIFPRGSIRTLYKRLGIDVYNDAEARKESFKHLKLDKMRLSELKKYQSQAVAYQEILNIEIAEILNDSNDFNLTIKEKYKIKVLRNTIKEMAIVIRLIKRAIRNKGMLKGINKLRYLFSRIVR